MPHTDLPEGVPGIRSAMQFRPETVVHLNALAEQLLRADDTFSRGYRELIAAYVSSRNKTVFCERSHSAFAAVQLDGGIAGFTLEVTVGPCRYRSDHDH